MAAKRKHVMTPARQAALKKAQAAAVRSRRRYRLSKNRGHAPKTVNRGEGFVGLKKNLVPYVRVNKRSQTGGFNVGTIIPGTGKRVVFGGYTRVENTHRHNSLDMMLDNITSKVAPRGSRQRAVMGYFKKNVTVTNPAVRARLGGAEVRLGTSRGAGPTIIVRRGKHKVSQNASMKSIKRYDTQARKLHARRAGKPRAQRRRANG